MGETFIHFEQLDQLNNGINLHDQEKKPDRPVERFFIAFPEHDEEANIRVVVESGYLAHY